MDTRHIPVNLLEPVASLYHKCKNAKEGARLDELKAKVSVEYPELSEKELFSVVRIAAELIVDQLDSDDSNLLQN